MVMKAPATGRLLCSAYKVSLSDLLYLLSLLLHVSTTSKVATELRLVMSLLLCLHGRRLRLLLLLLLLLICIID